MNGDWMVIMTASGGPLDLMDPDPAAIEPADIAQALSRLDRWNGQGRFFFPVAAHSLLAAHIPPGSSFDEYRAHLLLHDAAEAYIGDIARPMKQALGGVLCAPPGHPGDGLLRDIGDVEDGLLAAVSAKLGLAWPWPDRAQELISAADDRAAGVEWHVLMPGPNPTRQLPVDARDAKLVRELPMETWRDWWLDELEAALPLASRSDGAAGAAAV
jgi:hypothetical protein